MLSLGVLPILASLSSALVLPHVTPNCSAFALPILSTQQDATFLNATYYPVHSLNVSNAYNNVSLCEVYASVSYGSNGNDSLTFAVWLPERAQYENRFMTVGNGGMAGVIDYVNMLTQLNSGMGFAVAGGNAGHVASDNNAGSGEPGVYLPYLHDKNQVKAWIHDAISLFTPAARALTEAYYGQDPTYSYYDGCSTGGAQGFALAQYHPELFEGIVAGSPGNWYSHLALSFLWNAQHTADEANKLPQELLNFITNATLDACDLNDGVADRLIENPLACDFDINSLACHVTSYGSSSNATTCLTPDQLSAAKSIYTGPVRSDNGSQLYPGFSLGSESEWALQQGDLASAFSVPILQNLVYDDLSYNASTFNWASDVGDMDAKAGAYIDEISPDLSTFADRKGKLLVTQGWADPFNAATWPIEHLEQIQNAYNGAVSDFISLFMIPGGGHCGAATSYPGVPATYHTVSKLVQWVERGETPEEALSTDAPDGSGRTRKLCAWPATARYVSGHEDDWTSFVCE